MQSLVEIGPVVLERKIFNFHVCIFTIWLFLPLENRVALHLNNLESPLPKEALSLVLFKLAQWFFKFRLCISLFGYYLLLEKSVALHKNKFESPSYNDALYQVWLKWSSSSREDFV